MNDDDRLDRSDSGGTGGGGLAETIRAKLASAFAPERLEVVDESERHRGHSGWREGGETHFRVVMRAPALGPMSRVERSRRVHGVLAEELAGRVHALALDLAGTEAPSPRAGDASG
jgi:BolA family transcriptional regulator, general stress-responsive regulator